jgi:(p)ppGpp synthase/HD superfamily hydrolase
MPYLVHLVEVASEITHAMFHIPMMDGELAIQCALLHDTLEDTPVTEEMLESEFGRTVTDGVKALSKDPNLPPTLAMVDSLTRIQKQPYGIWAVKMADRIANLHAPPMHWDKAKMKAYQEEAKTIHSALHEANSYLAERLQMRINDYQMYL